MKSFLKSYFWIPLVIYIALYYKTLTFGSAWGDDQVLITPRGKDLGLMLHTFYQNEAGLHFIPFQYFQCYIINLIFGRHAFPFGFHLYQLILHIISCILASIILFKITKSKVISVLIVSLWAVHPLNVEVLTRIGCAPAQVAAGTFCLAFVLCFLKVREVSNSVAKLFLSMLGIFFFLASLTSYEQYFLFPGILIVILFYLEGRKIFRHRDCLRFCIFPIVLLYALYLTWKYFVCGGTLLETSDELIKWTEMGSIKDILFRALWLSPQLLVHYFRLFFYPDFLAESKADWYIAGESTLSAYSLFCQLLVFGLILAGIFLYKKMPLFSIGIFWFLISMVLVIQIIPLYTIIDEHYCYLSMLGIFLSVFSLIKWIDRRVLMILFTSVFCLLAWRTMLYIPSAKDLLSQAIYQAKYAASWLKPRCIANALYIATVENRQNELPVWLNEKTFENEMKKWLKNNLNVQPNLSHKYGPYQVFRHYKLYNGVFNYLYFKGLQKELNTIISQAIGIKNDYIGYYQVANFFFEVRELEPARQFLKKTISLNLKSNSLNIRAKEMLTQIEKIQNER